MTSPDQLKTAEQKIHDLVGIYGVALGMRLHGVLEAGNHDQLVRRVGAFGRTAARVLREGSPDARTVWGAQALVVRHANSFIAQIKSTK